MGRKMQVMIMMVTATNTEASGEKRTPSSIHNWGRMIGGPIHLAGGHPLQRGTCSGSLAGWMCGGFSDGKFRPARKNASCAETVRLCESSD